MAGTRPPREVASATDAPRTLLIGEAERFHEINECVVCRSKQGYPITVERVGSVASSANRRTEKPFESSTSDNVIRHPDALAEVVANVHSASTTNSAPAYEKNFMLLTPLSWWMGARRVRPPKARASGRSVRRP